MRTHSTCLKICTTILLAATATSADADPQVTEDILRNIVEPVVISKIEQYSIPGMSVGVVVGGAQHFFSFGVTSPVEGTPVTERTIFEVGSISKVFTATMAAYADHEGLVDLDDPVSAQLGELAGSAFDNIPLLDLGTYTAGNLPLQVPDGVNKDNWLSYYREWRPDYRPGQYRRYSNASIGLFGHIAANAIDRPFDEFMETVLFSELGLQDTFIHVPANRDKDYAFGTSKTGTPIRVNPGLWDAEAYGVKTSARDLLQFVGANLAPNSVPQRWPQPIRRTQIGHYDVGSMTQALGWEMYRDFNLESILAGNSLQIILEPNPAKPVRDYKRNYAYVNKTGSTNGFGAYVAFLPAKGVGIVMLSNKNYPIAARVTAAHQILTEITRKL